LFHDDAVQDLVHLRHVMSIRARDDEPQGDATPVHQQMPLAPIFSPDRLGSRPPIPVPTALSSWRHRCFAIATQSLRDRRIRPALPSIAPRRNLPSPIPGNAYELHSIDLALHIIIPSTR
jgi:hypothetical protein